MDTKDLSASGASTPFVATARLVSSITAAAAVAALAATPPPICISVQLLRVHACCGCLGVVGAALKPLLAIKDSIPQAPSSDVVWIRRKFHFRI